MSLKEDAAREFEQANPDPQLPLTTSFSRPAATRSSSRVTPPRGRNGPGR